MARNNSNLFLHVGFMKTGTTFLQDACFAKHKQIFHIGMPFSSPDVAACVRHLGAASSVRYDGARCKEVLRAMVEQCPPGKPALLSFETFTRQTDNDVGLVANRLKNLFPEAKIIFTVRNQISWLESLYLHELASPAQQETPLPPYQTWLSRAISAVPEKRVTREGRILENGDFFSIASLYKELYGAENVTVLTMENMATNPKAFSESICSTLGIDSSEFLGLMNTGRTGPQRVSFAFYKVNSFSYYFVPQILRQFALRAGVHSSLIRALGVVSPSSRRSAAPLPADPKSIEFLNRYYGKGNQQLAHDFGLDLAAYGYPLG